MIFTGLKNNVKVSDTEYEELKRLCGICGADISGINIVRNEKLSWRKATALFSLIYRNTFFICGDNHNLITLARKVCHEFKHREQFKMSPLTYMIVMAVPFLRDACWFEKEAIAFEEHADMALNIYLNNLSKGI